MCYRLIHCQVRFEHAESAAKALSLDGQQYMGYVLKVKACGESVVTNTSTNVGHFWGRTLGQTLESLEADKELPLVPLDGTLRFLEC